MKDFKMLFWHEKDKTGACQFAGSGKKSVLKRYTLRVLDCTPKVLEFLGPDETYHVVLHADGRRECDCGTAVFAHSHNCKHIKATRDVCEWIKEQRKKEAVKA